MRRIMEGMDWGDALQFVAFGNVRIHIPFLPSFREVALYDFAYTLDGLARQTWLPVGQVGADQVDECQHYVLVAPQNVVGSTIATKLQEMVRSLHSPLLL